MTNLGLGDSTARLNFRDVFVLCLAWHHHQPRSHRRELLRFGYWKGEPAFFVAMSQGNGRWRLNQQALSNTVVPMQSGCSFQPHKNAQSGERSTFNGANPQISLVLASLPLSIRSLILSVFAQSSGDFSGRFMPLLSFATKAVLPLESNWSRQLVDHCSRRDRDPSSCLPAVAAEMGPMSFISCICFVNKGRQRPRAIRKEIALPGTLPR
jgi:hypothetical protein